MCILCVPTHTTLLKVVSHYGLSVLSMSVMRNLINKMGMITICH